MRRHPPRGGWPERQSICNLGPRVSGDGGSRRIGLSPCGGVCLQFHCCALSDLMLRHSQAIQGGMLSTLVNVVRVYVRGSVSNDTKSLDMRPRRTMGIPVRSWSERVRGMWMSKWWKVYRNDSSRTVETAGSLATPNIRNPAKLPDVVDEVSPQTRLQDSDPVILPTVCNSILMR